jgi:hypothetical protein
MALFATAPAYTQLPRYTRSGSPKSGQEADDKAAALFEHSCDVQASSRCKHRVGLTDVYFPNALHHGNPEFLLGVVALVAGLVQSQSMGDGGISRHPYARASDGGELASDLPPESIGRAELEPLLWSRRGSRRRFRRR